MKKDNFDFENEIPETSGKKFADLDLGLDFDLSFLDDMDESVLEEEPQFHVELPEEKKAPEAPVKKAPAKKPVKKAAPAAKPPKLLRLLPRRPQRRILTQLPKRRLP